MDQLSAMQSFVRVVEAGSFSAAAVRQNSTQGAISKRVAALEKKLGIILLTRSSRHQLLTEAGELYYRHCVSVLSEIEETEAAIRSQVALPEGMLRVSAPVPFGRMVVAPLVTEFVQQYPNIELELSVDERNVDLFAEGIDVAIRARELPDSSLVAIPLMKTQMLTVASADYCNRHGLPASPDDLKKHDCIVYTSRHVHQKWYFSRGETECSVPVSGSIRSNSADTIFEIVLSGGGIGQLPQWMVAKAIRSKTLLHLFSDYQTENIPFNFVYPQNRYLPVKVRCFMDFMKVNVTLRKS